MNQLAYYKRGIHDGTPIALGYFAVSFTFGIAAKQFGLDALQSAFMSCSNLTSAGQFAALGVIGAGAPLLEMALTQLVINLRYCLMSCAVSQHLDPQMPYWHRFIMAFGITDEIFGISIMQKIISPYYMYGIMSVAVPGWTAGTALGVLTGQILPLRIVSALSVALYSMFIAVIVPGARDSRVLAGLIPASMLASLVFTRLPLLRDISYGTRIIVLTVLLSLAAAVLFPVSDNAGAQKAPKEAE